MREQQRMEKSTKEETPLLLMRMALGLLDRSGESASATACHLRPQSTQRRERWSGVKAIGRVKALYKLAS